MLKSVAALGIIPAFLSGCATVAPATAPMPSPIVTDERVVDRSYKLGVETSAYVGGTMARVRDYLVEKTSRQGAIHPSTDFTMYYPPIGPTARFSTAAAIRVVGTTERNGKTYRLVTLSNPHVKFLLNDDGSFEGSALGLGDGRMGWTYTPNPTNVRLREDTSTSAVSSRGYLNFELVYSGVSKDSIRLLYREYTQNDLVRPAFTQDLVYERDAKTIRFRNIQLRVLEASGEQIRFVVAEDGYPP